MGVGEADVAAAAAAGEGVVVHAKLVEGGGPAVMDGAGMGDGVAAEVIRGTMDKARLHDGAVANSRRCGA